MVKIEVKNGNLKSEKSREYGNMGEESGNEEIVGERKNTRERKREKSNRDRERR